MGPARVLARRRTEPVTPYPWRAWHSALQEVGLLPVHAGIVQGLTHGFRVDFPAVTQTQAPPNRPSVEEYRSNFDEIVANEAAKGRYVGPFNCVALEAAIGPFQSSPFSIIPKPGRPGKFRIIQNFSFPQAPSPLSPNASINSSTSASKFPCTWGTFQVTCATLVALPPGSQAAVRDVSEAYRTVPLHSSQWPAAVARTGDDVFWVDVCAAFGARPSGGVYGQLGDAASDLFRAHGMGPVLKWVDDYIFCRVPCSRRGAYNQYRDTLRGLVLEQGMLSEGGRRWFGSGIGRNGLGFEAVEDFRFPLEDLSASSPRHDAEFCYNLADIDALSARLGIPWESSKDVPFGDSVTYIGLRWDLAVRTVGLPGAKCEKYLEGIAAWQGRSDHSLEDVQSLYGRLLHACLVVPAGRARLVGLEAMLGIYADNPFIRRRPVKSVSKDLEWWVERLRRSVLERPIPDTRRITDYSAFSDASSEVGIGIVVGGRCGPGDSCQDGRHLEVSATSLGQKLSASSSSWMQFSASQHPASMSGFLGTTWESSRGGGTAAAATDRSTRYSSPSTASWSSVALWAPSTHPTSEARTIQLMPPPVAHLDPHPFSSTLSQSLPVLWASSSMHSSRSPPVEVRARRDNPSQFVPAPKPPRGRTTTNGLGESLSAAGFTWDARPEWAGRSNAGQDAL